MPSFLRLRCLRVVAADALCRSWLLIRAFAAALVEHVTTRSLVRGRAVLASLASGVAVTAVVFSVALAVPPAASAYVGANPVVTDWPKVWTTISGRLAVEARTGTASVAAKTSLWRGRTAAARLPRLKMLPGYLPLGATSADFGWRIMGSVNGWLNLRSSSIGSQANGGQAGCTSGTGFSSLRWGYYASSPHPLAPVGDAWYLLVNINCNGWGGNNQFIVSPPAFPCGGSGSYASAYAAWMASFVAAVPIAHRQDHWNGVCHTYSVYITNADMENAISVAGYETYTNQPPGLTTTSFTPASDPGSASPTADATRAALLSGDYSTDDEVGKLVDPLWEGPSPQILLERYVPQLRYPADDTFRADSAAMITDNYTASYSNALFNESNVAIAYSDLNYAEGDLSLGFLGSYGSDGANHHLDEHNDTRTADAQRLHGDPNYANKVYGRIVTYADGSRVLQYWLFYYFNWHPLWTTWGDHEGDWEMVQIHLDATGAPTRAAYAQHNGGERCEWVNVQKTAEGRPIAYVATGSHATYFSSGSHVIQGGAFDDHANGDGDLVVPQLVDVTTPAAWLNWKGRWGGSNDSPAGPQFATDNGVVVIDEKWTDPAGWSSQLACTENQSSAPSSGSRASAPAGQAIESPSLNVRIEDNTVVTSYAFPNRTVDAEPLTLVTAVKSSDPKYPPLVTRTEVTNQRGEIRQPLGLGSGPFQLYVRAYAQHAISDLVQVAIR